MSCALSACQKSLAEFAPAGAKKCNLFFAAACTWQKILLGPQVCELSADSGQRVRAVGRSLSRKSGFATFSTVSEVRVIRHGPLFLPFSPAEGPYRSPAGRRSPPAKGCGPEIPSVRPPGPPHRRRRPSAGSGPWRACPPPAARPWRHA